MYFDRGHDLLIGRSKDYMNVGLHPIQNSPERPPSLSRNDLKNVSIYAKNPGRIHRKKSAKYDKPNTDAATGPKSHLEGAGTVDVEREAKVAFQRNFFCLSHTVHPAPFAAPPGLSHPADLIRLLATKQKGRFWATISKPMPPMPKTACLQLSNSPIACGNNS